MESRAVFLTDTSHRIRFVYTPKHSSWLNQIECWFSILVRRYLLPAKTLVLLDRGFYHFQFLQQLINQQVHFITRLKAKASIKQDLRKIQRK